MAEFTLRDACIGDLPQIVAIYNASIPGRLATGDLEPVSVGSRKEWFAAHSPDTYPLVVSVAPDGSIAGWASLNFFFNGRASYRHTAEISIYVALPFARQGIAGALTEELVRRCGSLGLKTLLAFIFAHNEASVQFFLKHGFACWGHLPRIADMYGIERDLDIYGRRLAP